HPDISAIFFFSRLAPHRALLSFPTRRSSDLPRGEVAERLKAAVCYTSLGLSAAFVFLPEFISSQHFHDRPRSRLSVALAAADIRSEEHTSELQSLTNLVCRLLLEKKK